MREKFAGRRDHFFFPFLQKMSTASKTDCLLSWLKLCVYALFCIGIPFMTGTTVSIAVGGASEREIPFFGMVISLTFGIVNLMVIFHSPLSTFQTWAILVAIALGQWYVMHEVNKYAQQQCEWSLREQKQAFALQINLPLSDSRIDQAFKVLTAIGRQDLRNGHDLNARLREQFHSKNQKMKEEKDQKLFL